MVLKPGNDLFLVGRGWLDNEEKFVPISTRLPQVSVHVSVGIPLRRRSLKRPEAEFADILRRASHDGQDRDLS
jgi:hypothetical protein